MLVLLPTVDLLSQTIRSWRLAGRKGTTVAVCSARQALDHEPVGTDIPLTTDPAELTALTAGDATVGVLVRVLNPVRRSVHQSLPPKPLQGASKVPSKGGVMESLGNLFMAAVWGIPLVTLLGGAVAVAAVTRWRRREIRALKRAEEEQGGPALEVSGR
ncbi:hypothetical protein [Streptomyces sp. TN58]|uniref:hypothetical protein n=1 Tax=Streptomyces sp. TN58 TaxID=234612 RepID=UPI000A80E07E|nr:hypothetical protein [Streptomyces sp. TN58]